MKKILIIFITYLLFIFNSYLLAQENNKLKIGLLAPFTGEYKELGNSILFSLQLALEEIDDKDVIILPKDSGSGNAKKLNTSLKELIEEDVKVVIGPIKSDEFEEVKKFKELIFISPSNVNPEVNENILSIGISLESQLVAISKFINKQKKTKTLLLYPNNEYSEMIEKKIKKINLSFNKKFKYSPDPKVLTGEIEKLTNYSQRKKNLNRRIKLLEKKDDPASIRELKLLEQKYTLGKVNFDSVIVIDFGNSLKSLLTSLIFSDVNQEEILFTTVNQWFDKSIFFENSLKTLYYPSVKYKNYERYSNKYFKYFKNYPSEITILTYDALGLIYYVWKKNKGINSVKDFLIKEKIKGKIGTFSYKNGSIFQELEIYRVKDKKFTKF
tara:strand:- start:1345 stop:2496 length:1152 start_codon:yes stop_codon:yes gene_type:complete